jgi:hypothetical protein
MVVLVVVLADRTFPPAPVQRSTRGEVVLFFLARFGRRGYIPASVEEKLRLTYDGIPLKAA